MKQNISGHWIQFIILLLGEPVCEGNFWNVHINMKAASATENPAASDVYTCVKSCTSTCMAINFNYVTNTCYRVFGVVPNTEDLVEDEDYEYYQLCSAIQGSCVYCFSIFVIMNTYCICMKYLHTYENVYAIMCY